MWRDQARAAQAPADSVRVPDDEYRQALTSTGFTTPAADWSIANLPAYRTTPHKESGGRFYGGYKPDVGRIEVNNDITGPRFAENMHHEAWHGGQYAYRTPDTPYPPFQIDLEGERADFQELGRQSAYPDARDAANGIMARSTDAFHFPIDLDDRFAHDTTRVPPWYAARRMPMQNYGPSPPQPTAVSVGTNPFGPTPLPPAGKHRVYLPLANDRG